MYLRIPLCAETLKTDGNVANFAGLFCQIYTLNIAKFIPVKIISLMIVKKVKDTVRCNCNTAALSMSLIWIRNFYLYT